MLTNKGVPRRLVSLGLEGHNEEQNGLWQKNQPSLNCWLQPLRRLHLWVHKDRFGDNGDGVNPLLQAGLANNGGPTQTTALQGGSPAIDAIPLADCTDQASTPSQITVDQRGFPRPDARGEQYCVIGSYESGF